MKQLSFTNLIPDFIELPEYYWDSNLCVKTEVSRLMQSDEDKFIYLWGAKESGKSHMLQTLTQELSNGQPCIYLPLDQIHHYPAQCLENLEDQHLVILDDIQVIARNADWELGIFHLFNRIRQQGTTTLIISGNQPPQQLGIQLPDLCSRLCWGSCYQIKEPSDELKLKILIASAQRKGFSLPPHVAQYLLSHSERQLSSLMKIVEQLDIGSLEAQRQKISIPFVKKYIDQNGI